MRLAVTAALVLMAVASASGQRAASPRTPWGDPDLQGTYTNTYENGTPFERPAQGLRNMLSAARAEERNQK